ncbi:uncharacterized protein [Panulirus ornatus]|uniref:uncharacterized protein isoform X4 n=1 Tax=Panulirus ornatus TaxID=150431 RepID=UPI003A86EAFD
MCVEGCLATVTLKLLFTLDLPTWTTPCHTSSMAANTPTRSNSQRQSSGPSRSNSQRQSAGPTRSNSQRHSAATRSNSQRHSAGPSRANSQRESAGPSRTNSQRQSYGTTRANTQRELYSKGRQQTTEGTQSNNEAGGMMFTSTWVVRLSASLAILGGAFLFSGVSVLTNSFGQSHPTVEGPDKTSGIIFLAIACVSLVVSVGLGYYGCRKRKKKDEDDTSDSVRALSFAPALSTTGDMFPWPSTPSHNQPFGSPYSTPAAGQPPSFPFPGEMSHCSANQSGEPPQVTPQQHQSINGLGGQTPQQTSPAGKDLPEAVELPGDVSPALVLDPVPPSKS